MCLIPTNGLFHSSGLHFSYCINNGRCTGYAYKYSLLKEKDIAKGLEKPGKVSDIVYIYTVPSKSHVVRGWNFRS